MLQAKEALAGFEGDVLVMYGDVPLVRTETMRAMVERLHQPDSPAVVVLGFSPEDAGVYGRIIATGSIMSKMVEYKDATAAERAARRCNSGLMATKTADRWPLPARVGNENGAGED